MDKTFDIKEAQLTHLKEEFKYYLFLFFVALSVLVGFMYLTGNVYAQETTVNTYTISETGELIINENTNNEIIIDYSIKNNAYIRTYKGRYIDRKTGLDFKNRFFYLKYKNEGKIYKRYVRSNSIYFIGLEFFLQHYDIMQNNNRVVIITGVYQP